MKEIKQFQAGDLEGLSYNDNLSNQPEKIAMAMSNPQATSGAIPAQAIKNVHAKNTQF